MGAWGDLIIWERAPWFTAYFCWLKAGNEGSKVGPKTKETTRVTETMLTLGGVNEC